MLKRHDTDAVDSEDPKRVRVTHKQSDKRADSEKTNETVAKRAKLSDSQSSSSSSHFLKSETAPNTYDSSGEIDDPLTRESVAKNARVGADMDVGAIEVFTNAKLEVGRALGCRRNVASSAGGSPLESEAVSKAAELKSIRDKRVYNDVYDDEAYGKVISGAERVRGRRDRRGRVRQHDDDSVGADASLPDNRPRGQELHCVHGRSEDCLPQRKHEGQRRGVREAAA